METAPHNMKWVGKGIRKWMFLLAFFPFLKIPTLDPGSGIPRSLFGHPIEPENYRWS